MLVLLHLVLALLCFVPTPFTGGDNASYASLARSLLQGRGYVELWDPALRPHTAYPPVFPAMLALLMAAGAGSWVAFKLLVTVSSAAAVGLSYLWMRRVAAPAVALAVGVLLAISPGLLELSHQELSDVPFWAFTMLALWACAHLAGRPTAHAAIDPESSAESAGPSFAESAKPSAPAGDGGFGRWDALAVIAVLLAYFTRSAGLPLVVAMGAWLALRRRWRTLAMLAVVVGIPALLWWLRARTVAGPGYLGAFWMVDQYRPEAGTIGVAGLASRAVQNARLYVMTYLPALTISGNRAPGTVASAVSAVMVGLAMVGWARRVRRPGVAELFLPLYLGMMLILPTTWQAHRYVLPLFPLVLFYAADALREMLERLRQPMLLGVAAAALCGAASPAVARQVWVGTVCSARYLRGDGLACMSQPWRAFFTLAGRTRGRLPEGAVVLARKPTLFFALSGYRSRAYPYSNHPEAFLATAREAGAAYLMADRVTPQAAAYLEPVVRSGRLRLCTVPGLTLSGASLLRMDTTALLADGTAPPASRPCTGNPSP